MTIKVALLTGQQVATVSVMAMPRIGETIKVQGELWIVVDVEHQARKINQIGYRYDSEDVCAVVGVRHR